MDQDKLYYFLSVARHLSFTKAAEDCKVVQSTISKQVAALEKELGAQLIVRDKQMIRLTPAGERLAEAGATYLTQYRNIQENARNLVNRTEHKLRLVVGPFEFPLLGKLAGLYRGVSPALRITPQYNAYRRLTSHIRAGSHCLAIAAELCAQQISQAETVPLGSYRWVVVARADSPYWDLPPEDRAVLRDQYVLTLTQNEFDPVFLHIRRWQLPVQGCGLGVNYMTALAMLQAGDCVTLMPEFCSRWLPPDFRASDELAAPLDIPEMLIFNRAHAGPQEIEFFEYFKDLYQA